MDYRTIWKNLPKSGNVPYSIVEFEDLNGRVQELQDMRLQTMNDLDKILRENWTEQELMDAGYLAKSCKDLKIVIPDKNV